jgi:NADH:ubiquinone oxidoreductase subunit 2 (subunit N)
VETAPVVDVAGPHEMRALLSLNALLLLFFGLWPGPLLKLCFVAIQAL